jgi:murein DD-endopeptidase MepM/ murein hydrolase activator NlpD
MVTEIRERVVVDPSGHDGPVEHGPPDPRGGSRRMLASAVWGGTPVVVTSEHGADVHGWNPTCSWYQYGLAYGLNGCQHPGMDIGLVTGTALFAAEGGRVVWAGPDQYYQPMHVNIETASGEVHIYGHMSSVDPAVAVGGTVQTGQFLGASGSQNGDHLHFERRVPSAACTSGYCALDPEPTLTGLVVSEPVVGFAVRDRIAVSDPPLRFRAGPGLGAVILAELPLGAELCVTGAPQAADGHDWYPVTTADGAQGWVAGGFCRLVAAQGCG